MLIRVGCCCGAAGDDVSVVSAVGAGDGGGPGAAVCCAPEGVVAAVVSVCAAGGDGAGGASGCRYI